MSFAVKPATRALPASTESPGRQPPAGRNRLGRLFRIADTRLCGPGELPAHGIHRILVCRPNHRLGNTVLVSPLLRELERLYPGAEIDLIGSGGVARALFDTRFQIHRILSWPHRLARHPWRALQLLRELRHGTYDMAVDPCIGSFTGRMLLSACRARFKVGFPAAAVPDGRIPRHLAQRSVHVLREACGAPRNDDFPVLNIELSPWELNQGAHALATILGNPIAAHGNAPVIGVFTHATGAKRLPEAWWGEFIATLRAHRPDIRVVDVLAAHGRSQLPGVTTSFYTRDLRKLAAVLAHLSGFVSADGGVMHLAAATGVPTLGFFTLPIHAKYTPYGPNNRGLDIAASSTGSSAANQAIDWLDAIAATSTIPVAGSRSALSMAS